MVFFFCHFPFSLTFSFSHNVAFWWPFTICGIFVQQLKKSRIFTFYSVSFKWKHEKCAFDYLSLGSTKFARKIFYKMTSSSHCYRYWQIGKMCASCTMSSFFFFFWSSVPSRFSLWLIAISFIFEFGKREIVICQSMTFVVFPNVQRTFCCFRNSLLWIESKDKYIK